MRPEDQTLIAILGVVFLVTVVADLILLAASLVSRVRPAGGPPLFAPRWSLMDVWIGAHALVAGLIPFGIFAVIVVMIFFGAQDISHLRGSPLIVFLAIGMAGQTALMIGIPVFFITQRYRVSLAQIGLRWPPRSADVHKGVVYGLGLFVMVVALQLVLLAAIRLFVGPGSARELEEVTSKLTAERMLKENRTVPMFLTMLVVAGVLAPLSEEIFFRGFLYNAAKRRFGIAAGALISGLVFGAVHFGPLAVIMIVPMGILLALAYEKTGSLWVPIAMHAANNFVAVTITFLMPNLRI